MTHSPTNQPLPKTTDRFQFGLRPLLILTTIAAILISIGVAGGPNAMLIPMAMALAAANALGRFPYFQSFPRWLPVLVLTWIGFFASMFLPTYGFLTERRGWEAAVTVYALVFSIPMDGFPPATSDLFAWFIFVLNSTANTLLLISPLALYLRSRERWKWYPPALALSSASTLTWSLFFDKPISGYLLWSASFLCLLTILRIRPWVFWGYAGINTLWFILLWLEESIF